ncbi:hypothetical protein HFU84_08500 [Acidithiobacillus sp. CV18-2]|nr:hypothetical protein [Acidithiobacillus sp. CV18-3]MBU2777542.1 hypothetical protein [Acidithiobacillus sp. CV18-2]MBU2799642.1 hypothetical protein [Acidithiobacillus sp. VAN18-4]
MNDQQIAAWVRHWLPGEYDKVAGFFPPMNDDVVVPPCVQAPWLEHGEPSACDMAITSNAILLLPQFRNTATHGAWLASLVNPHRYLWQPAELWMDVYISSQRIDLYQSWKIPARGICMSFPWPGPLWARFLHAASRLPIRIGYAMPDRLAAGRLAAGRLAAGSVAAPGDGLPQTPIRLLLFNGVRVNE